MLRKLLIICCAVLVLAAAGPGLQAEETEGEIRCWLSFGDSPIRDGALEIFRAGDPVPEGYRLNDAFGGGIIAGEDVPSAAFALWMSQRAVAGTEAEPDKNGLVCFSGLEPGMYLIRQSRLSRDCLPIEPYLACVSPELSQVDTYPELTLLESAIPRTAQYPEVFMGTMGTVLALSGLIFCARLKKQEA